MYLAWIYCEAGGISAALLLASIQNNLLDTSRLQAFVESVHVFLLLFVFKSRLTYDRRNYGYSGTFGGVGNYHFIL